MWGTLMARGVSSDARIVDSPRTRFCLSGFGLSFCGQGAQLSRCTCDEWRPALSAEMLAFRVIVAVRTGRHAPPYPHSTLLQYSGQLCDTVIQ
jgi:hypothetical protein